MSDFKKEFIKDFLSNYPNKDILKEFISKLPLNDFDKNYLTLKYCTTPITPHKVMAYKLTYSVRYTITLHEEILTEQYPI